MTDEEKQELINAMKAESQSVDELEAVESLDNVTSLPAVRGEDVVSVPISLLSEPAETAAETANAAAVAASCLELKDKLHGCQWDWLDWLLTITGGALAAQLWLILQQCCTFTIIKP